MHDRARTQTVGDDQDEIIRVSDQLSRMELYGAAQMVLRLARERDDARRALGKEAASRPWRLISDLPEGPCGVELFTPGLVFHDSVGNKHYCPTEPGRDERRSLAYFDGSTFRQLWTGHEVFEFYGETSYPPEIFPTHYRILPPVPNVTTEPPASIGVGER